MPICSSKPMSARELKQLYGGKTREEALANMSKEIARNFEQLRHICGFVRVDAIVLDAPSQDGKLSGDMS